jgi:hypothetical protein
MRTLSDGAIGNPNTPTWPVASRFYQPCARGTIVIVALLTRSRDTTYWRQPAAEHLGYRRVSAITLRRTGLRCAFFFTLSRKLGGPGWLGDRSRLPRRGFVEKTGKSWKSKDNPINRSSFHPICFKLGPHSGGLGSAQTAKNQIPSGLGLARSMLPAIIFSTGEQRRWWARPASSEWQQSSAAQAKPFDLRAVASEGMHQLGCTWL